MIVLDTHAWIWWVGESPDLSRRAKQAIAKADEIGVHAISCWEVAMLVSRKRLGLSMDVDDWIGEALRYPKVTPCRSNRAPPFWPHGSPEVSTTIRRTALSCPPVSAMARRW